MTEERSTTHAESNYRHAGDREYVLRLPAHPDQLMHALTAVFAPVAIAGVLTRFHVLSIPPYVDVMWLVSTIVALLALARYRHKRPRVIVLNGDELTFMEGSRVLWRGSPADANVRLGYSKAPVREKARAYHTLTVTLGEHNVSISVPVAPGALVTTENSAMGDHVMDAEHTAPVLALVRRIQEARAR